MSFFILIKPLVLQGYTKPKLDFAHEWLKKGRQDKLFQTSDKG
jgi:hypothetical protein